MANYYTTVVVDPFLELNSEELSSLEVIGFEYELVPDTQTYYISAENPSGTETEEWENILTDTIQKVLKRNNIPYATIEASLTCSKRKPDGFGGMAWVVTQDKVHEMSTGLWISTKIAELCL